MSKALYFIFIFVILIQIDLLCKTVPEDKKNLVEPIKDKKKIQDMKVYLKGRNLRDRALFIIGINVALGISDSFKLTWKDILNEKGKGFMSIKILEGKTNRNQDDILQTETAVPFLLYFRWARLNTRPIWCSRSKNFKSLY